MTSKSKVYFFIDNVRIVIKKRTRLKEVLEILFAREKMNLISLNYVFCSDETLLSINRQYLKHDYYTDIVTFNFSKNKAEVSGEAYISVDRVKENALKLNVSPNEELFRVMFHGALHLCGYTDKSSKQKFEMRRKEDYYISLMA
jgi:probable rRNA maturation factor